MAKKKFQHFKGMNLSLADATSATQLFAYEATRFLKDVYIDEDFDEASTANIIFELGCLFDEEAAIVPLPKGHTIEAMAERLRDQYELRLFMMGLWNDSEEAARNIILLALNDFFEQLIQKFDDFMDFDDENDEEVVTEENILAFITDEETQKWFYDRACFLLNFE